jgi:hypothetical protein
MEQNRERNNPQHGLPDDPADGRSSAEESRSQSHGSGNIEARDGAGNDEPSAPERQSGSESAATRDFGERMQDLDRAGTVDEGHDRRAGGEGGGTRDGAGEGRGRSTRQMVRDHALTLGLAASSLALLAGTTRVGGGGGAPGEEEESVALAEGFMPPEMVAAERGVTWDLHHSEHERIDFFVEFLMGRNYDKTRSWLERIGKYGPLIHNELSERGMPQDLLYLAMIESGLNPTAYSKAHASGMWQFIKETGQRYGLEVSTYVDERNDPVKSTAAGLTYLQMMHDRFDSWYLASAGYNTGENRVGRLMRERTGSEKGTDEGYWDIWDRLPRETRDYVPLMVAMGRIAKEPAKYGFHNLQYEDPLAYEEVVVPGGTKLSDVAAAAGVGADVMEDLNPHFIKKQTPPNRRMAVRVPVGQQQQVAMTLNGQPIATGATLAE